jgi:hypothetical protein
MPTQGSDAFAFPTVVFFINNYPGGGFLKGGVLQNGWLIRENPIGIDGLRIALF